MDSGVLTGYSPGLRGTHRVLCRDSGYSQKQGTLQGLRVLTEAGYSAGNATKAPRSFSVLLLGLETSGNGAGPIRFGGPVSLGVVSTASTPVSTRRTLNECSQYPGAGPPNGAGPIRFGGPVSLGTVSPDTHARIEL